MNPCGCNPALTYLNYCWHTTLSHIYKVPKWDKKFLTNVPQNCTVAYRLLVFAELRDLSSLLFHPGDQPLQLSLQILPLLAMLSRIYLLHQLLMLTDKKKIHTQITSCVKENNEDKKKPYSQAHLSELVLQSQQQVRQWAKWLICSFRLPVRRWGEVLLETFLGGTTRPLQSAHSLTQLGLMVLHHVKDTLYVGVDWVARACRLWQVGEIKMNQKREGVNNNTCFFLVIADLPFLQQKALFCALGHLAMPTHSAWRFSEVEDSSYHHYVQINIFLNH